ncbi:MAG: phytoene desaturase family protein [Candidatus Acidiferrales bacterium]
MTTKSRDFDAVVIGSGPNGLAAAITLAQGGHSVIVYEAEDSIGGGARSAELTLPGFVHDVCSCVHPMAAGSPFFRELDLGKFGLRWIFPEIALAHPFDDGDAVAIGSPFERTLEQFGKDAKTIRRLLEGMVQSWPEISPEILRPPHVPKHPLKMAMFGWRAIQSARKVATRFQTKKARAVLAGMAAHSVLPLDKRVTGGFGLILWATCYAVGWPFAAGGSQSVTNALAALLKSLGGEVVGGTRISSLAQLPKARAVLCDITPRQFLAIGGAKIANSERRQLERYRYGPGSFKMDWALDAPIPWRSVDCRKAGTIHVGGTFEEIAESESAAWAGVVSERPFVLVAQPSLFDPNRAPAGKHTAWAYCHVPHGSNFDMRDRIEAQIERFAPGFRDRILARSAMSAGDLEAHNANLIGGDIGAGSVELRQFFLRPSRRLYSTSLPNVFICSASTPPGPGVHGMCGHFAAKLALKKCF